MEFYEIAEQLRELAEDVTRALNDDPGISIFAIQDRLLKLADELEEADRSAAEDAAGEDI